jgi:hypothetical protein
VNGLLIQGGGAICASLDVAGAAFDVDGCTGVDASTVEAIRLWPNPAQYQLTVVLPETGLVDLRLVDLAGRTVLQEGVAVTSGQALQLELPAGLATGAYTLRLDLGERRWEQRVMVAR